MKKRTSVKINVDMFDDTKLKIIDTKPERDLIHYIWFRMVTLAGKVNRDGELYLSRNIPYTPEIFAIEFNRGTYQINIALGILMELEMIDIINENVYRVKNFSKHQNGTKSTQRSKNIEKEKQGKEISKQVDDKEDECTKSVNDKEYYNNEIIKKKENKVSKSKNKDIMNKKHIIHLDVEKLEIGKDESEDSIISNSDIGEGRVESLVSSKKNFKKNRKNNAKRKNNDINESNSEEELQTFCDGEITIKDGKVIKSWSFDNTR